MHSHYKLLNMSFISSAVLFKSLKTNLFVKANNVRTLKTALKIKWVRPEKIPHINPAKTGDRSSITKFTPGQLMNGFENSEELKTADENVKKIFSIDLNNAFNKRTLYKIELENKVRRHPYDISSHEVYIARLTATIRYLQEHMKQFPKDVVKKVRLLHTIDHRKRMLTHLRRWDYKRFEWVLEQLNLEYRPYPNSYDQVARKRSMTMLTNLHCEEIKEKKIAEYREKMDKQKLSFLENKLEKLKWMQDQEAKYKLQETVTQDDIEACVKQLEKVQVDLENVRNKSYVRVIHPYTFEKYYPDKLNEAEGRNVEQSDTK